MRLLQKVGLCVAVLLILLTSLFPFYYAILTSLKSGTALFEVDYFPTSLSLTNYWSVLTQGPFLRNVLNSFIVAGGVVLMSLVLAVTAAYAFSRIPFPGRTPLMLMVLSVSMFPVIAVLPGLFELVRLVGLYNSVASLILAYLIFTLPFTVWVLTSLRELPLEIEEAAIIDGASALRIVWSIFLPLLWPALVATGLLAFIGAWNEFLFALTFISIDSQRTVPVAIAQISGATQFEIPWGNIMAASVIVTVPLIVLVLIFQRRIIVGLTAGATKG